MIYYAYHVRGILDRIPLTLKNHLCTRKESICVMDHFENMYFLV